MRQSSHSSFEAPSNLAGVRGFPRRPSLSALIDPKRDPRERSSEFDVSSTISATTGSLSSGPSDLSGPSDPSDRQCAIRGRSRPTRASGRVADGAVDAGRRARLRTFLILFVLVLAQGCFGGAIGVERVSADRALRELEANALTHRRASNTSRIVLRRHDLAELYARDPDEAIERLRRSTVEGGGAPDELFALSELSFLQGRETGDRAYFLAAALYAYAIVVPPPGDVAPAASASSESTEEAFASPLHPLDPRLRVACDIYNVALGEALERPDGYIDLSAGAHALPYGMLEIDLPPDARHWAGRELVDLVPVTELRVEGLRNRYRQAGIGVPLVARTQPLRGEPDREARLVSDRVRVPTSAVLRVEDPMGAVAGTHMRAELELYTADGAGRWEVADGFSLPLEFDSSAALAMSLEEPDLLGREIQRLRGIFGDGRSQAELIAREPYRPGRIPVVFVHGTGASVTRWADLVNDLDAVPKIRSQYQFWFFAYNSGNPIAYSSMLLRRSLTQALATLDPSGSEDCLRDMVVVGHSQGGLLARMTAIRSGDRFWRNLSGDSFEAARLRPATRSLLDEALFVEPLPFVRRLVFIATPHRGSFLAGPQLLRRLAARLIRLPGDIVDLGGDLTGLRPGDPSALRLERLPTSLDNMSPRNPFIRTLARIPIAPGVAVNSIIPVQGEGPLESLDDGVVKYTSAHLEAAESEFIVQSGHSVQSNPNTVAEMVRILSLHAEVGCAGS